MDRLRRLGLNSGAVAYASTWLGCGMMHSVFMFYYVNIFINKYHVPSGWFNIAQVVYMIWNAVNDPLFGYIQDNCKLSMVRSRRHTILYGAPLFAISFLLPWFPWTSEPNSWITGVHLMVSLCLYDAMFTYVILAGCCILAEATSCSQERILYTQYGQIASLLGSTSVFFCSHFSENLQNFETFQHLCILIAILSWISLTYTGLSAGTMYDKREISANIEDGHVGSVSSDRATGLSIFTLTLQILKNFNFLTFVCVNFLSEFHRTGVSNTAGILTSHLIPQTEIGEFTRSLVNGAIVLLPQVLIIGGRHLLSTVGYYRIMKRIFIAKVLAAVTMLAVGRFRPYILLMFIIVDATLGVVPGTLGGLALSDVIDDDANIHKRKHPLSSMVFGTNALVTKPANSLAPMMIVSVWNYYGYEKLKQTTEHTLETHDLHGAMFNIMCLVPFVVGLLQFFIWRKYGLKYTHTTVVVHEEH